MAHRGFTEQLFNMNITKKNICGNSDCSKLFKSPGKRAKLSVAK